MLTSQDANLPVLALVDSGAHRSFFSLVPAFSEHDVFLLGRADFFQAFTVTFEEDRRRPVFHLDR